MDKERNTIVCIECDNTISEDRYKLGYTECLDCSTTEKYASHTVYPHKTGGYIQPMSAEQASNMKRLDRRAAGGGTRKAKGISHVVTKQRMNLHNLCTQPTRFLYRISRKLPTNLLRLRF